MNIEAGKFYKTRDGRKARIYAVDGSGSDNIHGAILIKDGWDCEVWDKDGAWVDIRSPNDLVSEWVEPRTGTVWVNIYSSHGKVYTSKEAADNTCFNDRVACVEVNWTEGEGL